MFIGAAQELKAEGIQNVRVVSELIDTHDYESKTLRKDFEEITCLYIQHDVIAKRDLEQKLYAAIQCCMNEYDGWTEPLV